MQLLLNVLVFSVLLEGERRKMNGGKEWLLALEILWKSRQLEEERFATIVERWNTNCWPIAGLAAALCL